MNEYTIINTNKGKYDRMVLCLTFESLLTYINKIEDSLSNEDSVAKILIDQLLVAGNGKNRFVSLNYMKGKLDFDTAKTVSPPDYYRKETVDWLHNNYMYVENSILTNEQRNKIQNNIAF